MQPRGSVHGFAVTAGIPFRYLRPGSGEPLTIRQDGSRPDAPGERLAEIRSRNALTSRVYRRDGAYSVHMEGVGWFGIDPATSAITVPTSPHAAWLEGITWGLPVALMVLARGGIFFHAAAVEIDGRAVLFTGPSHHGKTTLAGAFAAAGCRLLAEDLVRCTVDRPPAVYPGPAMLRLRKDVADWLDVPGADPTVVDPEKLHLALDPRRRGTCDALPLAGIVFLHVAPDASIERMAPLSTIQDLWAVSLNIPTPAGRARCFHQITELAETVPIWRLSRPLTRDALGATIRMIIRAVAPA